MDKDLKSSQEEQRQFWKMVFDTHKSSGLNIKQFCKNEGISEAAFYAWRKKLAAPEKSTPAPPKNATSAGFIQVSIPEGKAAGLELVLTSGHILRINPGVDNKILSNVLSALKQADLC